MHDEDLENVIDSDQPEAMPPLDPIFASSLRELKWILVAWLVCGGWTLIVCRLIGYEVDVAAGLNTMLGMPAWVFWGVVLPWCISTAFTIWFVLCVMEDHPLPEVQESADSRQASIDSEGGDE